MKKQLFFLLLCCITFVGLQAQTITWTGAVDANYSNANNWNPAQVPTTANDVVVPTGSTMTINVNASVKSIVVQGTSNLTLSNGLSFTNASSFSANTTTVFSSGNLNGGGTLTNNGVINVTSSSYKYIYGNTVLNNTGTINFIGNGPFFITNGIVNNQLSGILDMKTADGNILISGGSQHKLNNYGIIKRSNSSGVATIGVELHNDGGTIDVETGELTLNYGLIKLTGGEYNVSTDSALNWYSTVTCAGTLTGALDGQINWNGTVSVPLEATFNFSGNTGVNWVAGTLSSGGTLTNESEITLLSNSYKYLQENTILNNKGEFNIESSGNLFISNGTINNRPAGIIDLIADNSNISYSGGSTHILNNYGLLKQTAEGTCYFNALLNNNAGTISVENGVFNLYGLPKYLNDGVYNVTTGASMQWNSQTVLSGTLTGVLDGDISWNSTVNVPVDTTATFNFTGSTGVNWNAGSLNGGGTLINQSEITLLSTSYKYFYGNTILNNNGNFNIESSGNLFISDGTLNNQLSGVLSLLSDAANIGYSGGSTHVLNNQGLIKQNISEGTGYIQAVLNNNNGTISVENGFLNLYGLPKYLNDGIYNLTTEASLLWNSQTLLSGTLTGVLDGKISWLSEVNVPDDTIAVFNFTGDTGVNWNSGNLRGGGTLINQSEITLLSPSYKYLYDDTILNNEGLFNIESSGSLFISNGIIDNQSSGIIDLKADDSNISYSGGSKHILNNAGLLKQSASGTCYLEVLLNNNDGTISVENGVFQLLGLPKYLNDGIYNISSGSNLLWYSQTILSGTLTGVLDGNITWNSEVNIPEDTEANFNFTGDSGVHWSGGNLNGGGTLINQSEITLIGTSYKYIYNNTTLNNTGFFNFEGTGAFFITDGILNNQSNGIMDVTVDDGSVSYSGGSNHIFNNFGLFKKSAGSGTFYIGITTTTNSGTIDSQSGTLNFVDGRNLINTTSGIIKGTATIDIPGPANFTNDGTFSPGGSPGILTVLGTYKSSSSSVLDVELNGLTVGTEYDQLAITGTNAIFEGTVNVDLGFEANEGDTFIIATVSSIMTTKNLVSPVYSVYGCREYTFNITYPNDKSVVLTVSNKGAVLPPEVETQDITVQLDLNGDVSITPAQIDNGSAAGCTEGGDLIFSLDRTDFSCADIGENTVTLTVMDEDGNSASGTAIVTVEDDMQPTVVFQNISAELNANGSVTISAADIDNGSFDNCSITLRSLDITTFNCSNIGANTVIFTATDQSGNISTANVTVTVTDPLGSCNEAPVAVCQTVILNSNADCQANATAQAFDGGSTDPNGLPLTFSVDPVGPYNVGVTEVILTVSNGTDSDSCTTTITVVDNTPPVANCAAPFTVQLDASGQASISVADIDNGSSDSCGIASITIDSTDFSCGDVGENTVTLTVTDISGNVSTCSTVVTVTDPLGSCNEAPIAVCQAVTMSADSNCWGNASAADFDGGSTDPNGSPLTFSVDPVGPYLVGTTTVTLTVSNGTSSDSCTTTITVVDDTPPMANCVAPFTLQLDANGNAYITEFDIDNGSMDNCGIVSIAIDKDTFDCADIGENEVTLTVTDSNGNSATCTTLVTIQDSLAPTVITQDITVQLDANGNASISASDIDNGSLDNCGIATTMIDKDSFSCSDIGVYPVTLTVTDASGNSSSAVATVTVEDPLQACGDIAPEDYFITTWLTTYANETITIPTFSGETYNYSVDWGDGNSDTGVTQNASHNYVATGLHAVKISGNFPRIYFNNTGDRRKIKSIEQWGTIQWSSMNSAFMGAENLVSNATDIPDLSMVTDMYGMFAYARVFNGDVNMGNWDVSNVNSMYGTFGGASIFNHDIGNWNVSNVTNMENMFFGATIFNQDLGNWNVSNVTSMENMFRTAMRFNQDIGNWDVSNVTNMYFMFFYANRFNQNLGAWNVSNVTIMTNMFKGIALSTDNYDALLNGWSSLPLKSEVRFGGGNSKYCAGETARQNIISNFNWTITDGGKECSNSVTGETLALGHNTLFSGIELYPNPMKDQLTLGNPNNLQLESIYIYDLTGRLIQKVDLRGMASETSLDVSKLSSATYMVLIVGEGGQTSKLLLKE